MSPHVLQTTTIINRPLNEVFDFFSKAENLNLITPPDVHFQIVTPLPIKLEQGALIDYRIRVNGMPFSWQTEISVWDPPHRFADRQLKGPYVMWVHTHSFRDMGNGQTEMTDRVEYLSPGWFLEPLIHRLFVKKKVEAIFSYRESQMKKLFPETTA